MGPEPPAPESSLAAADPAARAPAETPAEEEEEEEEQEEDEEKDDGPFAFKDYVFPTLFPVDSRLEGLPEAPSGQEVLIEVGWLWVRLNP